MSLKNDMEEDLKKQLKNNLLQQYSFRVNLEKIRRQRKNATGEELMALGQLMNQMIGRYTKAKNTESAITETLKFLPDYQDREPEMPQSSNLEV